jgi:hypothetical protein
VAEPASALICVSPTGREGWPPGQQLQLQGGQVAPAGQAGQAQAQPPPAPPPPSDVTTGCIFAQTPLGQGVVKQAIPSEVHPHWSAVSATHDFASM